VRCKGRRADVSEVGEVSGEEGVRGGRRVLCRGRQVQQRREQTERRGRARVGERRRVG
jgi:hypothetical protein